MIEDAFQEWYWELWEPNHSYLLKVDDLKAAYKAGWKRSQEVDEALTELVYIAEDAGEYD